MRGLDCAAGNGDAVYDRSASEGRWHTAPDEFVQAELADAAALAHAVAGIDVVIHLAATPDDLGDPRAPGGILESNVLGVYNICDAARTAGVKRLMLTSSQQAVGGLRIPRAEVARRTAANGPIVTLADGTAPTNMYALSKVFSETIGQVIKTSGFRTPCHWCPPVVQLYAIDITIDAISLRIWRRCMRVGCSRASRRRATRRCSRPSTRCRL